MILLFYKAKENVNMKRLTLEYRVRRLEHLVFEELMSDLDKMSNDIYRNKYKDDLDYDNMKTDIEMDAETDQAFDKLRSTRGIEQLSDIYGHTKKYSKDKNYGFDTVDDWADAITINACNNWQLFNNGDIDDTAEHAISYLKDFDITLSAASEYKKAIKELQKSSTLIAQQKLVNAIRKRIRLLKSGKWTD